jgi:hypothetical protein
MNRKLPIVLFAAVTACAFAQQSAVVTTDWKPFVTKDGKFSINAPKGWGNADPNDASSKAAVEKIKANNPKMAKMYDAPANKFDLYLFDYASDASKGLNNIVVTTIKDSGLTPDLYPDVATEVFKQTGMKNPGSKVIDLPAGKTLSYWGELPVAMGEGVTINFKVFGYMVIKGNSTYICTMTTLLEREKTQKPIFDAMAKSIVLK